LLLSSPGVFTPVLLSKELASLSSSSGCEV
jgi:hypothetical protein